VIGASEGWTVFVSSNPDAAFAAKLRENAGRVILALGDPVSAAVDAVTKDGEDLVNAIRKLMASCSAVISSGLAGQALVILSEEVTAGVPGLGKRLAQYLNLSTSKDEADLDEAVLTAFTSPSAEVSAPENLEDPKLAIIRRNLLGFHRGLRDKHDMVLAVTRDLMFDGNGAGPITSAPIDATGRPRLLTYGPYVNLPTGRWRVEYVFASSAELAATQFELDVSIFADGIAHIIARRDFTPATAGRAVIDLDFSIDRSDLPIEVRLSCTKAIFDGQLAIGYLLFRSRSEEAVARDVNWAAGLDPDATL
jgi:hypothetical protein